MTLEEAIKELKIFSGTTRIRLSANFWEALNTVIKALEQETCEDAVSRSEIQQKINRLWNSNGDKDYCMEILKDFVTDLPPVTPAQRWIPVGERLPEENQDHTKERRMKKIIKHIQRWNIWRKSCLNGPLHKFLVLVGLRKSPSMQITFTPDEIKAFKEGFEKGLKETQSEWAVLYEGVPVNIEEFDPEEEEK